MRAAAWLWLFAVACTEDLGIDAVLFECASNADCSTRYFCERRTNTCVREGCGDGVIAPGEDCDVGESGDSMGCRNCRRSFGWTCSGAPSTCSGEILTEISA